MMHRDSVQSSVGRRSVYRKSIGYLWRCKRRRQLLRHSTGGSVDGLLRDCLTLTYNAIHYAEENGISNRNGMKDFYRSLKGVELPSCYEVAVISRACTVVESRKKSGRRGVRISHPKPLRPVVCIISGFFITAKGRLFIPLRKRDRYADVVLNRRAQQVLEPLP